MSIRPIKVSHIICLIIDNFQSFFFKMVHSNWFSVDQSNICLRSGYFVIMKFNSSSIVRLIDRSGVRTLPTFFIFSFIYLFICLFACLLLTPSLARTLNIEMKKKNICRIKTNKLRVGNVSFIYS